MCGVSARESISGGRGRGCWIRDLLMFVWVKFCCLTSIVEIRLPGFQSANRAERGHMFFEIEAVGNDFTTLGIFLNALFLISTLDIKLHLRYHNHLYNKHKARTNAPTNA
jgi:hypothetical protein